MSFRRISCSAAKTLAGSAPAGAAGNVQLHPSTSVSTKDASERSRARQWQLQRHAATSCRRVIGVPVGIHQVLDRIAIDGRQCACNCESGDGEPGINQKLPSRPLKTARLPPEPSTTEMLRRMARTLIFAFAAALTIVGTIPSSFAKSGRRTSTVAPVETPASARRRRREILVDSI